MLDQNTDRMWYVIGAVLVGAAIILIANGAFPQMFASVTDTFEDMTELASNNVSIINNDIVLTKKMFEQNHVRVSSYNQVRVRSTKKIDLEEGQKYKFITNAGDFGYEVQYYFSSDYGYPLVTTTGDYLNIVFDKKDKNWTTEDILYEPKKDGYLYIMLRVKDSHPDSPKLTPNDLPNGLRVEIIKE